MRRIATMLVAVALGLGGSGCVEIQQLIKMQHDGSGTMTETITVKPRALRLMESQEKRTGKKQTLVELLSDEAVQTRAKAYGEVTVKDKKVADLPDGSKQIVVQYAFQDVNKFRIFVSPLFKCTNKDATGQIGFQYSKIIQGYDKKFYKANLLGIRLPRHPQQKQFSSPSITQDYRRVTPIFLDMLRDLRFRVEIQAPDDVEEYEKGMVVGMHSDGNKVLLMNAQGVNVILNSELIRGFSQGEVGGHSDAWGGDWRKMELGLPNTVTPYGAPYEGFSVRFLKLAEVPNPAGAGGGEKK